MKNPFAGLRARIRAYRKLGEQKLRFQSGLAHKLEIEKLSAGKKAALLKRRAQVTALHPQLAKGLVETWKSALYRGFNSTASPKVIWEDARSLTAEERAAEEKALALVGNNGLATIYSSDEFHAHLVKPIIEQIRALDRVMNMQPRDPKKIEHLFSIIHAIDPKLADKVRAQYARRINVFGEPEK